MTNKTFYVVTPTEDFFNHCYNLLINKGFKQDCKARYPWNKEDTPHIGINNGKIYKKFIGMKENEVSYTKFLFLMERDIVKLNDQYSAEINMAEKTIKVGCQKFPFSKIDELYEKIHQT